VRNNPLSLVDPTGFNVLCTSGDCSGASTNPFDVAFTECFGNCSSALDSSSQTSSSQASSGQASSGELRSSPWGINSFSPVFNDAVGSMGDATSGSSLGDQDSTSASSGDESSANGVTDSQSSQGNSVQGDQSTSEILITAPRETAQLTPVILADLSQTIQASFDAAAEIGSNRAKWAQVGQQGEDAALETLVVRGYRVLAAQLYVSTSVGLRITDFVVTGGPAGDEIVGFEVKVNGSAYTLKQQLKDSVIASPAGGVVVNWNQLAFPYGTAVQYTTYLMYVEMTVP
jgi:hypothetical protein